MKSKYDLPKKPLKVAVIQMRSVDELMLNVAMIMRALAKLRGQGCDLICLPENALFLRLDKNSDMASGQVDLKEKFWRDFQDYVKGEDCAIIFGSVSLKRGKKCTNAMVIVEPNQRPRAIYEKIHLFDVEVSGAPSVRESDYFHAGKRPQLLKYRGWKIGLSICYDMRFSELYARYAREDAHLLLVPSAFLVPTGRAHWEVLLRARAIESQAYVVAPAQSGGHKNKRGAIRETYGHSLVVSPWGEIIGDLGAGGASVKTYLLSPELLRKTRVQIPMSHHRRL